MILAAILILTLIGFILIGLNRLTIRPGYSWFLVVGGSIAALILIALSFSPEPQWIALMNWESSPLSLGSPALLVDTYSWPFAIAVVTLLISVLLTDVAQVHEIQPNTWIVDLGLAVAGLLAVLAGTPLALLMAWALIDLTEMVMHLRMVSGSQQRERVVVTFFVRAVGMSMVVAAILRAQTMGIALTFLNIPSEVSSYLILAAGLRLGILPPHPPFIEELPTRRGLGTMTRLVPVAASFVLLIRVAEVGVSLRWELLLTITSLVSVLYGALTWILSRNELDGRPYWIFGMSSLSIAGVIQTQGFASQVWGLALLFSGGVLFLYSARSPRLLWLPILGLIGFSGLPFTPSWYGILIFSSPNFLYSIPYILGLAFLIMGYVRHMMRPIERQYDIERWVWLVYPLGLATLPLTHFWVIFSLGGLVPPEGGYLAIGWWGAVLVLGTAGLFWALYRHQPVWTQKFAQGFRTTTSLGWLYRSLWWGYRTISKFISYLAILLEGQGGVLWAVLIVILLILFIFQRNGGG